MEVTSLAADGRLTAVFSGGTKQAPSHTEAVKLGKYIDKVSASQYRLKSAFSSWRLSAKHNLSVAMRRTELAQSIDELLGLALCISVAGDVALAPENGRRQQRQPITEEVIIDRAGIPRPGRVDPVNSDRKSSNQQNQNCSPLAEAPAAVTTRAQRTAGRCAEKKPSTTCTERNSDFGETETNVMEPKEDKTKPTQQKQENTKTCQVTETQKTKKEASPVPTNREHRGSKVGATGTNGKRCRANEVTRTKLLNRVSQNKKAKGITEVQTRTVHQRYTAETSKKRRSYIEEEVVLDGGSGAFYKVPKKRHDETAVKVLKRMARKGGVEKADSKARMGADSRHRAIAKPKSSKQLSKAERRRYHAEMEGMLSRARAASAVAEAKEAAARAQHAGDPYQLACLDIGVRMLSRRYAKGAAHPKKRLAFERDLRAFMRERKERQYVRTIRGKEVELFNLFSAVMRLGGYEKLEGGLRDVFKQLGYDVSKTPRSKLAPIYVNELYAYEAMLVQGREVSRDELRQLLAARLGESQEGGKRSSTRLAKV